MVNENNKESEFKNILEQIGEIIFISKDFRFLYINSAAKRFFSFVDNQHINKRIDNFISIDTIKKLDTLDSGEKQTLKIKTLDNCEKWIELSRVPIQWNGENAVMNIIIDVSEHKKSEENLKLAILKAENADRLKSSFLANMSHEIRTPLNAIIGFSQLLSMDEVPEELKKEYYKLIDTNSFQLLELIDDIIDLAKVESGQIRTNISRFNVNELMKEIFLDFSVQLKQKTNLTLKIKTPVKSEDIFIETDRQRVIQVITNLISNALKNTKKGTITIGYRIIDRTKVEFYVKDTGIGIQKELLDKVFDRFSQLNPTRNKNTRGTGLGLSISKKLIELLNGKIYVDSIFGKGATFAFVLPYKSEHKSIQAKKTIKSSTPTLIDWSKKTILLAEDEDSNFLFIQEALRRTNVNLIRAKDGIETLNILASDKQIDLILLDINMPNMDGYETFENIRSNSISTPVIAQTAYAMIEDKDKILALGMDSYISKPIQINVLLETILRFI